MYQENGKRMHRDTEKKLRRIRKYLEEFEDFVLLIDTPTHIHDKIIDLLGDINFELENND